MTVALAALATIAALVHDRAAPAADAKRTLVLLVGLGALALVVARKGTTARSTRHPAWTCALGFVALSALSALWGLPSGLLDLGVWVGAAAVAIAVRAGGLRSSVAIMRGVALACGGGASLAVLVSYARGLRGLWLHGGQGNPNWLGLLLAVTLPLSLEALCAWRARPPRRPALVAFAAASSVLQLPGLVLSHSRVAWVATAIGLAVLVVGARLRGTARLPRATMAIAALCALLAIGRASPAIAALGAPSSAEATPLDSLRGRIFLARVSAGAAVRALPFGVGLGGFGHAYLAAQGEVLGTMAPKEASHRFLNATTAHDDWLQVAIESGPLAVLLLAASLGLAVVALHRARLHGGSAALVACGICALGDSPLRQPAVVLVVALVLSTIPARIHRQPVDRSGRNGLVFHV
ncbi:MAG: O-antigen ligase family protein, partial [Polyangiales bacterium]